MQTDSALTQQSQQSESVVEKKLFLTQHKGNNNLLIRGMVAFGQAAVTSVVIEYEVDLPHKTVLIICQLIAALSLVYQWKTGSPNMFIVRACTSWLRCLNILHLLSCGRRWPGVECITEGWSDERQTFRIIHCFAAFRMFCNGISLIF
jgi:hypothetical protein